MEDKIVKYFLNLYQKIKVFHDIYQSWINQILYLRIVEKKPIVPSQKELNENIPSRSAKLRYAIKKNFYEFNTDIFEKISKI